MIMPDVTPEPWQHSHDFTIAQTTGEKNTKIILILTLITMVAEVTAGTIFGSLALLADGWHMATHVGAFGITVFAYSYARKHAKSPQYTFGSGKVSVLGGFTSAIVLGVVALAIAVESSDRLLHPQSIQFNEAILVAIIGLVVNLISALLLQDHHGHHGHHGHHHHDEHHHPQSRPNNPDPTAHAPGSPNPRDTPDSHSHHHHDHHHDRPLQDHNLQAAYFHVLADALTSVLAIVALFAGKFLGWLWLDAVMGFVGAVVITRWAYGLLQQTGLILLDASIDKPLKLAIVEALDQDGTTISDLHVWNLSENHVAATIALVTDRPQTPDYYKTLLRHIPTLDHVVVEVNPWQPPLDSPKP